MSSSNERDSGGSPVKKKVRGSTKLRSLVKRHEEEMEREHVEFDADLNPIGEQEDRFISYIGYLGRSKVGILHSSWKEVPKETKTMIWEQLLQTYDVPNTKEMYKHWMGEVRERWKDFKSTLTTKYIRGSKRNKDPCEEYTFLSPDEWRSFVASRQDPEFLKLSEANKEKRAKNNYTHYMSRGGYRKLEKKLMEADLKKLEEAAKSDPSIVVQAPPPPPRHRKWKEGRMKGEKYINPIVADIAGRIDELEEQSSQGSFHQTGRMDILATAIGKLDHPGQVRGEPRGIGLSRYFGRRSQSHGQSEPSTEFVARIRQEI